MSNKITKIGKLYHAESFLQLNTVRGYEYIDRAGKLVNEYHGDNNQPPKFFMSLQGLLISNPKPKVDELRVSSNSIWIHFSKPDSLDLVLDKAIPEFKRIAKILNIQKMKRIGWRNYFIYEAKNKDEINEIFLKNSQIGNLKTELIGYSIEEKNGLGTQFDGLLTASKVAAKEDEGEKYGILFDIDLFIKNELNIDEIDKILKLFKAYLTEKKKFLLVINEFLSK